jgi:hypothetical protein
MWRRYALVAMSVASISCSGQEATAPVSGNTPTEVHSNLAQLMRGIPFTFANIVFDAQSEDPAAERAPADVGGGATATFRNVYGGWQEVENSALALAESATLMMLPGRSCENGKPVPVQEKTYQQAAQGLRDAGMAAYESAQTKSMDAMLDASEKVSLACSNCHEPYRDFDDESQRCSLVDDQAAE